jgi:Zn-dependent protease
MNLGGIFKRQILIARVYGIPVRIDYRWFIVFAMSVALIAANVRKYPLQLGNFRIPPTGDVLAWTLGIVTTLGLFVSVFGHELSHALMGRTEGIEIEEIVLHPFGGLARLKLNLRIRKRNFALRSLVRRQVFCFRWSPSAE